MTALSPEENLALFFRSLSQPERVRILLAILATTEGEACVCHLEAHLGLRQAYISQHLMAMRESGILATRRDGRYIYYRLADPTLPGFLEQAGRLAEISSGDLQRPNQPPPGTACTCPHCHGNSLPASSPLLDVS